MAHNFTIYMTTDCNFRCSYCYEKYENTYHLNENSVIEILDYIFQYGDDEAINLNFMGGEPLLKKELIYKAVDYIKCKYPSRYVKYSITTNGSLLDDNFIFFMKENSFDIRLSFDGDKSTHDLNRTLVSGISCYEKIVENIYKIKRIGLDFTVRMTITQNTIPHMYENICYLHENGFNNIAMIMDIYLSLTDTLKEQFANEINKITDYYIQEYNKGTKIMIDQFDGKLLNFLCDFGNCFSMCDAGITNFKIMPTGDIYPCGFLTNNNQFVIGNIRNGVNIEKSKKIAGSLFNQSNDKCEDCKIRDFCHGMKCGYANYIYTGKINIPSDAKCYCEQKFYESMIRIVNYYLSQSKEQLNHALGQYISYIRENSLQLSEYGMKIESRLKNS